MNRRERSMRESSYPQRRRTPSFSSTLLDAIYRSIDDSKTDLEDVQLQQPVHHHNEKRGRERMNLRQAVMIEDWMEKQTSQNQTSQFLHSSTSSSSECSSGGVFSSSETDTTYKKQRSKPKHKEEEKVVLQQQQQQQQQQKKKKKKKQPQREGGFARTKLKALKIYYGELNQKVRQPISPGSRIATFLSSIFSSENVKKAKMCYVGAVEDVSFEHKSKSPCFTSSASSFSRRSCMSKTPSSARSGTVKRSVRFYPVSVILGEDSEQQYNEPSLLPLSSTVRKITRNNNSSVKELKKKKKSGVMAKENGGGNSKGELDFRGFYGNDGEDEDDALSYSSSDLFELDHLIGAERYQEELPVYETTNLETNKAIANGLRL